MGAYPNPVSGLARPVGQGSDFGGGAGSNQFYNNVPGMPNPFGGGTSVGVGGGGGGYFNGPGGGSPTAQGQSPWIPPGYGPSGGPLSPGGPSGPGSSHNLGHGIIATGPQYPGLSSDFANYIMSQIGQGLPQFGGQVGLPTGGQTAPGQLTAGMNPLLAQLAQFFQTGQGGGMPGMSNLSTIANQGVSALPEWQSMIAAMGQNTAQNQAQLQEQFAGMGDLAGSPFATGMSNYMQQTNLDQNALLGQLQQSNIQNIQMPAINELFSGSQAMAGGLQSLDQSAIDKMYQQFQTTMPQNNPLMQEMMGLSTLYPPTTKTATTWENLNSTIGALTGSGFSSGGGGPTQIGF